MIHLLMIVEWPAFTLGSITIPDKKLKWINYQLLCVGLLKKIAETYLLDQKIQYHENRTHLSCLSIYKHYFEIHEIGAAQA